MWLCVVIKVGIGEESENVSKCVDDRYTVYVLNRQTNRERDPIPIRIRNHHPPPCFLYLYIYLFIHSLSKKKKWVSSKRINFVRSGQLTKKIQLVLEFVCFKMPRASKKGTSNTPPVAAAADPIRSGTTTIHLHP